MTLMTELLKGHGEKENDHSEHGSDDDEAWLSRKIKKKKEKATF